MVTWVHLELVDSRSHSQASSAHWPDPRPLPAEHDGHAAALRVAASAVSNSLQDTTHAQSAQPHRRPLPTADSSIAGILNALKIPSIHASLQHGATVHYETFGTRELLYEHHHHSTRATRTPGEQAPLKPTLAVYAIQSGSSEQDVSRLQLRGMPASPAWMIFARASGRYLPVTKTQLPTMPVFFSGQMPAPAGPEENAGSSNNCSWITRHMPASNAPLGLAVKVVNSPTISAALSGCACTTEDEGASTGTYTQTTSCPEASSEYLHILRAACSDGLGSMNGACDSLRGSQAGSASTLSGALPFSRDRAGHAGTPNKARQEDLDAHHYSYSHSENAGHSRDPIASSHAVMAGPPGQAGRGAEGAPRPGAFSVVEFQVARQGRRQRMDVDLASSHERDLSGAASTSRSAAAYDEAMVGGTATPDSCSMEAAAVCYSGSRSSNACDRLSEPQLPHLQLAEAAEHLHERNGHRWELEVSGATGEGLIMLEVCVNGGVGPHLWWANGSGHRHSHKTITRI